MKNKIIIEACVDSVQSAINAEKGGAGRIELCDNLMGGGTTPSKGMIEIVKENIKIPINILIRPRTSDFFYDNFELNIIKKDIEFCKEIKVNGVVIGMLNSDGSIDLNRMKELIEIARPLSITFHRAFDMTRDPFESLEKLIELGIDRVLTSGRSDSAYSGQENLKQLIEKSKGKIIILPGGGINQDNAKRIIDYLNVREIHIGGSILQKSKMMYKNENVKMGKQINISEYEYFLFDEQRIRNIIKSLD